MRKRINLIFGIIISVIFIYLAFRRVRLVEIYNSLRQANYLWIIPNMVVVIVCMVMRAERWRYLLAPVRNFKMDRLFPSVMIGFMANNVLPARLGEVVRAYSLGAKTGESRSSIFASVVLERVFDSLALLAMFWLVILFIPFPAPVKRFGIVTLILNILIIMALILMKKKTPFLVTLARYVCFFLPSRFTERIEHIMNRFADGLSVFKDLKVLIAIIIWSVILWLLTALSNYFVFVAFGLFPNVASSFILLLFVAAGVMLPSAPGFIGVFHAATIGAFTLLNRLGLIGFTMNPLKAHTVSLTIPAFAGAPILGIGPICDSLGLFGISKGEALSFSIILWLCQYLPVTFLGMYYLRREHFSLRSVESR